jgi:hypothetical protein
MARTSLQSDSSIAFHSSPWPFSSLVVNEQFYALEAKVAAAVDREDHVI